MQAPSLLWRKQEADSDERECVCVSEWPSGERGERSQRSDATMAALLGDRSGAYGNGGALEEELCPRSAFGIIIMMIETACPCNDNDYCKQAPAPATV